MSGHHSHTCRSAPGLWRRLRINRKICLLCYWLGPVTKAGVREARRARHRTGSEHQRGQQPQVAGGGLRGIRQTVTIFAKRKTCGFARAGTATGAERHARAWLRIFNIFKVESGWRGTKRRGAKLSRHHAGCRAKRTSRRPCRPRAIRGALCSRPAARARAGENAAPQEKPGMGAARDGARAARDSRESFQKAPDALTGA